MLRIAVIDDHPIARRGLVAILDLVPDVEVVAAVAGPNELPVSDGRPAADVVLCDLYLTDDSPALDIIAELAASVPVLVVSASRAPADVLAAVQAGAVGYLTKHAREDIYATAIRCVAAGGFYLSSQLADVLTVTLRADGKDSNRPVLSRREQEALGFIARGFTHQQTATRMGLSKNTVDTYVERIRKKLQVGNKAELTIAALTHLRPKPRQPDEPRID